MVLKTLHFQCRVTGLIPRQRTIWAFPDRSVGKESACNAGDPRLTPGLGRSAGEGIGYPLQYSWSSLAAELRICLQCGRPGFNPWVGKIPWRKEWLPIPVFRPVEFHGPYSPWGCKESDTTEWLSLSLSFFQRTKIPHARQLSQIFLRTKKEENYTKIKGEGSIE